MIGISFLGWVRIVCDLIIAFSWAGFMKVVVSGDIFM